MTDRQVKTQECDFLFILTGLNNDDQPCMHRFKAMFIMKRVVAESVRDRASVHTRNTAFEAPEQYYSAPLLNVERSVSDRFFETV